MHRAQADARRQIYGLRPMGALFAAPCGQDALETAPRPPLGIRLPPLGIRLPQLLLDFDGCHSARARSLGLILGSCQFSLGIRELGQSVIESLTQLNDGCLSAGKLLAQLCYPRIGRRRLSMIVADIRNLTNDVRPSRPGRSPARRQRAGEAIRSASWTKAECPRRTDRCRCSWPSFTYGHFLRL